MSTPVPPPVPSTPLPTGPVTAPILLLTEVSAAFRLLAPGSRFEATVVADLGGGAFRLRFPQGTADVQSGIRLAIGATLTVALPNTGAANRLAILSINGKPILPMVGRAGSPAATPFAGGGQTGSNTALAAGLPRGTFPIDPSANPFFSAIGSTIALRALRPLAPGALPAIPAAIGAQPSPPAEPGTTTPATPAPAAAASVPLPAGTTVAGRVLGFQLPDQPAVGTQPAATSQPAPGAAPSSHLLVANVVGSTSGGLPLLQTPFGPALLSAGAPFPNGTALTIELTGQPVQPTPEMSPVAFASRAAVLAANGWPALDDVIAALREPGTDAVHSVAGRIAPRPDAGLAAASLSFLSALRSGDLAGWLGEAPLRGISRTRPEALAKLGEDFQRLRRVGEDSGPDGWRLLAFPLAGGPEIEMIRFFSKRGARDETNPDAENGDRFVFEVQLSRIGRLQLDGLYRAKRKRLDLIVRTDGPISSEMRDEIRRILREANDLTGLDAAVTFQSNPPAFIELLPDPPSPDGIGLVV